MSTPGFDDVLGPGRSGGQDDPARDELPATMLARFSVHPGNGLHLTDSADPVAKLVEHAQRCMREAQAVAAAAQAGWKATPVKLGSGGNQDWLQVTKLVPSAAHAVAELTALGVREVTVDVFPSGSPQDRSGFTSFRL